LPRLRKDNTSGCPGVNFHKASGKWRVEIQKDNVRKHFGLFEDLKEAIDVYRANKI